MAAPNSNTNATPKRNNGLIMDITASLNAANVAANTTAEQDFTVTGVLVGDIVLAFSKPAASAGLGIVNTRVKAADTIAVTYVNATGSGIDAAAETYTIVIYRPSQTSGTTLSGYPTAP